MVLPHTECPRTARCVKVKTHTPALVYDILLPQRHPRAGCRYAMAAMASAGVVKEQRIVVNEKETNISLFHWYFSRSWLKFKRVTLSESRKPYLYAHAFFQKVTVLLHWIQTQTDGANVARPHWSRARERREPSRWKGRFFSGKSVGTPTSRWVDG